MKLEHVAINVSAPNEIAEWYVKHFGMEIVRKNNAPPYIQFIGDGSGKILIELYKNPPDSVPDYAAMDPLLLHFAFVTEDPTADKERLMAAGATLYQDSTAEDGTRLVMLRDPWGLAIQLCKRASPMLRA
ncbi:MAG: VOC family protein [Anaerolineae bacterium]|nr:VOC family protein [Anaerolineae bacterium]